jgi:hypothetical protein
LRKNPKRVKRILTVNAKQEETAVGLWQFFVFIRPVSRFQIVFAKNPYAPENDFPARGNPNRRESNLTVSCAAVNPK